MNIQQFFIKLCLISLFLSCSDNNRISEFEKTIGPNNTENLNRLVVDFENNFLKIQYPNLTKDSAYIYFLHQYRIQDTSNFKSLKFLMNNPIRLELTTSVDSVWHNEQVDSTNLIHLDRNKINIRERSFNVNGDLDRRISESSFPYDLIYSDNKTIKDWFRILVEPNTEGKYWKGLHSVRHEENFVNEYIEIVESSGRISSSILAMRILEYDRDYSNYFIKRIIISEFVFY